MRNYPQPGACAVCAPPISRSGPCLDVVRVHEAGEIAIPAGSTTSDEYIGLDDDAEFWLMQVETQAGFSWPSYALLVVNDTVTGYPIFWLQAREPGAAGNLISLDMHLNPAPGVPNVVVSLAGTAITVLLASAGPASTGLQVVAALSNDLGIAALVQAIPAAGNLVSAAVPDPFGPTNLAGGDLGGGSLLFQLRDAKGNFVQNIGVVGRFVLAPALYFPAGSRIEFSYQNQSDVNYTAKPRFTGVKRFFVR